jgi:hypothetical protein
MRPIVRSCKYVTRPGTSPGLQAEGCGSESDALDYRRHPLPAPDT